MNAENPSAHNVYMAKLAEQAERYDEMKGYMGSVCATYTDNATELSVEERNLLSVAYKNAVGSRRASWRIVTSVQNKEESKGNTTKSEWAGSYKLKVEKELENICQEIIHLLGNAEAGLIHTATSGESKVFYHKMKGDYFRYIAEFKEDDASGEITPGEKVKFAKLAETAYDDATAEATDKLTVTHPIRLGLALNFSVFHYEVLQNQKKACDMARAAFEDAIAELDNVSEDSYKDSTLIMQLLRDNLTLWTSDDMANDA